MQKRRLGNSTLDVSAIGLGCMGMRFAYGTPEEQMLLHAARGAALLLPDQVVRGNDLSAVDGSVEMPYDRE